MKRDWIADFVWLPLLDQWSSSGPLFFILDNATTPTQNQDHFLKKTSTATFIIFIATECRNFLSPKVPGEREETVEAKFGTLRPKKTCKSHLCMGLKKYVLIFALRKS